MGSIQACCQLLGEQAHGGLLENVLVMGGNLVDFEVTVQQGTPAQRRVRHDAERLFAGAEERHPFDRTRLQRVRQGCLDVELPDRLH